MSLVSFPVVWALGQRSLPFRQSPPQLKGRRLGLLLAFFLAASAGTYAQDYRVANWQVENGLPDNTVTALAQTPDGYLWVGTRRGLVRFDGNGFQRVAVVENAAQTESGIIGLVSDGNGGLWVAMQSGAILRLAGGAWRVESPPIANGPDPLDPRVWRNFKRVLTRDAAGDVWALLINGEIRRFAPQGGDLPVPTNGLPPGMIHGQASDGDGRVWLLKGTNACVLGGNSWQFSACTMPGLSQFICPAGPAGLYCSMPSASGFEEGVVTLEHQPAAGWRLTPESVPTTPAHPSIMAMLRTGGGRLWLAQRWGGLYQRLPDGRWRHVRSGALATLRTATCLFEDDERNLWAGTDEQGLFRISEPAVQVTLLPQEAIDASLHVTTVSAARDGGFWAGTDAALYHGAPGQTTLADPLAGLAGESIYSVLEDSQTNLWVGTQSGLWHRTGRGFQQDIPLGKDSGGILALYEARNGSVWAAGPHDSLFVWPGGRGEIHFHPIFTGNHSSTIGCIAQDAKGRIWVGTRNTGLWRVDEDRLVAAGPPDLFSSSIRALLFDREDTLWVGTDRDGLFCWRPGFSQRYTMEDGLPSDVILGLAADDRDNIWMTSHDGIVGVARRQLAAYQRGQSPPLLCWRFPLDEGLRICSGAGQPVLAAAGADAFWAATMAGVTRFNSRTFPLVHSAAKQVHVDALLADGSRMAPSAGGFKVPAGTRRLEFQYSVPELAAPENLRFRYRLDGLDLDWLNAGSLRSGTYSQLSPGAYRFRVMLGGADGLWREAGTPVDLRVIPPFWQTRWFRGLSIVTAVLVLTALGVWNERRKVRRRLERLEAKQALEQVRNRIARDLHDELGSSLTTLLQRGAMILRTESEPEALRAKIKTLFGRLRELSITLDEVVWTMNSRNDTLPNLAGYISSHAQEFLQHSGIKCRLDVAPSLPDAAVDSRTRHDLFLAVKEALNNAAKHSAASEIIVRVHYDPPGLRVSIEDNGRGFETGAPKKGEGLANMAERLQAVNGRAEISSQPGRGTAVVFSLNLPQPPAAAPHPHF